MIMVMKKKHLEIELEKVPPHPEPKAHLEQYSTPSHIAADILFHALVNDDIYEKKVLDLGCGTGIFSIGAALLGADKVIGVDIDRSAVKVAKDIVEDFELQDKISFEICDIKEFRGCGDTIFMNPPFGAQKKGADIPFLEVAFKSADRIYSLHNKKTEGYIRKYVIKKGFHIFWEKRYMFEIDRIFNFHTDDSKSIEVILFVLGRSEDPRS